MIQENANRLHVADKILTKKLDATKVFETFGPDAFDKILVDAPCSGIGLIRRKPDIKYNKESADFVSLQAIQLAILDSVCQSVRKGGIIVYPNYMEATASLLVVLRESHNIRRKLTVWI